LKMKCPDCQGNLLAVSVTGFDESYRCNTCGGFWLQGWAVTKAAEENIDRWARTGLKADLAMATNKCPKDGTILAAGKSDQIPESVTAKKCSTCNWWWMPGDSLFDYWAAMAAKKNYFRWWGKTSDALMLFLPAVLVVVMAVGLAFGIGILRKNTQFLVPANTPKVYFTSVYEGAGKAKISISSADTVNEVELLKMGSESGVMLVPQKANQIYQVNLEGLEEGKKYLIRVNGEVYEFVAK